MNFSSWSLPLGNWKWWYVPLGFITTMIIVSLPQMVGVSTASLIGYENPSEFVVKYGTEFELVKFALMVILSILLVMLLSWKRTTREDWGLADKIDLPKTAIATVVGFLLFTVAVYLFEKYTPGAKEAGDQVAKSFGIGKTVYKDMLLILMTALFAPIAEEWVYRGLLLRSARDGLANLSFLKKLTPIIFIVAAVFVSSYLFATSHGGEGQDAQIWMLGLLAAICAVAYLWSGSLYAPVLIHGLNNAYVLYHLPSSSFVNPPLSLTLILLSPFITVAILFILQKLLPAELGQKSSS